MELDKFERGIPLPDDQFAEIIFKFVPLCQWSSCLELVSKQFRLCVLLAYSRLKSIDIRKMSSLKGTIKYLEMRSTSFFSKEPSTPKKLNNILTKLSSVCPNLTSLASFEYLVSAIDVDTWNILKKFDRLQSVSVVAFPGCDEIAFKDVPDFLTCCKSLKIVKVSTLFDVGGTLDVGSFTSLDIFCCGTISREQILLENLSENLTTFRLRSFEDCFQSNSTAIQALKMCTNLESLSVNECNMCDYEVIFNALPSLCKLSKLTVSGVIDDDDDAFDDQQCVQLDFMTRLKVVEFNRIDLSNEMQNFLFTNCSHLECIKLTGSPLSASVMKNLPNLPCELKTLCFTATCEQILPFVLPNLAQLSNFTDLTIRAESISEEWENICCLANLRHLRIYSGLINDSLLEKWDQKNDKMFEKLITLEIPDCEGVTDRGLCLLAKKAKTLQVLNLNRSRISDKTMALLADVAKKLTTVSLIQEVEPLLFDENDILHFIQKTFRLKKLELTEKMAKIVIQRDDFLPFVEIVEIFVDQYLLQ